tara:strand:+ start:13647 stop:17039 length:3393 start_codon:yes stop_codon:yes gene_type:complete
MMKPYTLSTLTLSLTTVALLSIGCSTKKDEGSLSANNASSLMAAPKEGTSALRGDLTRYRGQTSFLTATRGGGFRLEAARAAAPSPTAGAGPRAEQEADVFKVGKPGSKLLYLLNNYRGLQVVSYVDGTEKPKLLGRAEPTGNYPSDMYLDAVQDRLFVLERVWFDSATQSYNYNENQSRILVYDVSKPENPILAEKIDLKGEIADSRMVGSVLYTVTTLRPDTNSYRYSETQSLSQGIVTSFDLSGKQVSKIQEANLSLPAVYGNNLRVVTVPEGDSYKYYLIAHLSEHGWGWWDRQSMVQVVDISDDKGKIQSVMTVSVKGTIQRPHQMQIKNNTLIVVSNYTITGQPTANNSSPRIGRVAVETFKFPTKNSEILSENEAELRRLYIEKQVKSETDKGTDSEVAKSKWTQDATWGVYGRFVLTKDQVRKIMPDSVVTTGDTTGLSANLQDVRIYGDWLYVFWVPANQVDPLDLFDISAPEKGVRHVQRLTFDGWISRAEPISYKGKNYIVGLGWIVPAVNNEDNKRFAQVKLFEITSNGKSAKATEVSSLILSGSQFWANFSGEDKKIEFRPDENGKGEILFEGSRYYKNSNGVSSYQSGGQIISFDLGTTDTDAIFKEGSFLAGDSSWIRRIFTNSEINRINSFSDSSLVTFGANSNAPSTTVQAVNVLELARNIKAFVTVGDLGVQVITEGNSWPANSTEKTILRTVSKMDVDAEKPAVLSEVVLQGSHTAHLINADKKTMLVLTSKSGYENNRYLQTYQLHEISLGANKALKATSTKSWEAGSGSEFSIDVSANSSAAMGIMPPGYGYRQASFLKLASGETLVSVGNELRLVSADKAAEPKTVSIDKCGLSKSTRADVKQFNNELFLVRKTSVDLTKDFAKTYSTATRNELFPLSWQNQTLSCGDGFNIPGDVIAYDGSVVVVSDSWVNDIYATKEQEVLNTTTSLTSLKLVKSEKGTKAVLVDMLESAADDLNYLALPKSYSKNLSLMKYTSKVRDNYNSRASLQVVTADKDAYLTQDVFTMPDTIEYASLAKVFADQKEPGLFYGVVKSWRQIQVVKFQAGNTRPSVVPLAPVDWQNKKQKAMPVVSVLEGYSSSSDSIHFSPEQRSIEVSSGLFGVKQFFLE